MRERAQNANHKMTVAELFFTEREVLMVANVLKSDRAIEVLTMERTGSHAELFGK